MATLNQFQNKYSENLLSSDSLLRNSPVLNYNGDGSANFDTKHAITDKANSLELLAIQNIVFGIEETFDFGDALRYEAEDNGDHAFQFAIKIRSVSSDPNYTVNVGLQVYINNVLIHTFVNPLDLTIYNNDTYVFMSQSFFLGFEQVVNFKFIIFADSVGSPNPNFTLNFSGFKLEVLDKNTGGLPTNYSLPRDYVIGSAAIQSEISRITGWGDYVDTVYTSGSPFAISTTPMSLPNNKGTVIETQLPDDIATFYDGTAITGRNGDAILVTIDFLAKPTNVATTYLEVWVDITGGTGTPTNLANLYKRILTFPKGTGIERPINFTFSAYTLGTWEANGGVVKIVAENTCDIYNIRYVITRTHKARV